MKPESQAEKEELFWWGYYANKVMVDASNRKTEERELESRTLVNLPERPSAYKNKSETKPVVFRILA